MKISLDNIGIIKDSTINIEGITVITGKNNSGKTTVGKVVYSLLSATEDLIENATKDLIDFAKDLLRNNLLKSDLNLLCRGYNFTNIEKFDDKSDLDSRILILQNILNRKYPQLLTLEDMKNYIHFIIEQLQTITVIDLNNLLERNNLLSSFKKKYIKNFDNKRELYIDECIKIIDTIDGYSDFIAYERKKIMMTLSEEFNDQIAPVKIKEKVISTIKIENDNKTYSIKFNNKDHYFTDNGVLFFNENNNVVFIDDITVIDSAFPGFNNNKKHHFSGDDFENCIHYCSHNLFLLNKLVKEKGIVKAIYEDNNYKKIESKINTILNDDIIINDGKYVLSSDNLYISNLAMGSKLFAIIKMLLENGSINKHTILILDEPESHLHPEWQNVFSEIVAVLVKEIGVKVIITSHSPNFVLGMQVYSMKYNLEKVTNFYVTEKIDGYLVNYKNVNDNLNVIYSGFAKYFSEIKALFNGLVYGE